MTAELLKSARLHQRTGRNWCHWMRPTFPALIQIICLPGRGTMLEPFPWLPRPRPNWLPA